MANRKRNIQMKFYVTEKEKRLIDEKMAQLPTRRYGAYLRKMAIDLYLLPVNGAVLRLLRHLGKGPDVLVADLDIRKPGVLPGKLLQGLLSPVYLRLFAFLDFFQKLLDRFLKGLLRQLRAIHDQGDGLVCYFLLHLAPLPLPVPVHVVLHQGEIVIADRDRGVIQGRQQVFLDVADVGGVLPHTPHDILHMGAVQLHKPGFDHLRRVVIPGNADRLSGGAYGVHDELGDLVKLLPVDMAVLNQVPIPDVVKNDLPIYFPGSHPIRSYPFLRRRRARKGLGI